MSPSLIRKRKSQPAGTALVIVLTFLIILSGMVIAFMEFSKWDLQTSQASARQLQSQEIALGGADAVASLLLTEIDDDANSERDTVSNVTLYRPKTDANLFPERIVGSSAAALLPTLIKSSRQGVAPYAAATSTGLASQAPTATSSANGRSLDFNFWNRPRLIFPTPDAQSAFESTAAPDWILLTKDNGPKAFTTWNNDLKDPGSSDFVIGRYAYTVYDISGLLDISVAGRLPVSQTAYGYQDRAVLDAKSKPALIFADLSEIPGIDDDATVATFIAWRNATSASSATSFHDYVFPNDWTLRNFSKTEAGDNTFFSRSDLIEAIESGACGISAEALPYLTTFSRMKNAPSWSPSSDKAAPYRYKTDADDPNSINRNLAWVRVKNAFTRQDGTTAKVGEPLIKNRFPLSRFQFLTPTATSTTTPEILEYFGLSRSTAGGAWTYNHGNSGRILTLDEVADENREPDLPELLQATILNGSLASGDPGRPASEIEFEKTRQLLFILANLIDQQDVDSYPTLIQFNAGGEIWEVAGRESLPYLNKLIVAWGETDQTLDPTEAATAAYIFPQVARRPLHLTVPTTANSPPIRIRAVGTTTQEFFDGTTTTPVNPADGTLNFNSTAEFIPGGFARIPTYVVRIDKNSISSAIPTGYNPGTFGLDYENWLGIRLLDLVRPIGTAGTARVTLGAGAPLNFIMEFLGYDGAWHPYNRLVGMTRYTTGGAEILNKDGVNQLITWNVSGTGTPTINTQAWRDSQCAQALVKSDSWSLSGVDPVWCGSEAAPLYFNRSDQREPFALGSVWRTGTAAAPKALTTPGGFSPAQLSRNLSGFSNYQDLDGTTRKADGWRMTTVQNGLIPVEQITPPDPGDPVISPVYTSGYLFNRPFRSPAEIGAVFRGQPWRTLNFWTDDTADAGLLDIFTTRNEAVVAGVNPNTRLAPVLNAAMEGTTANLFGFQQAINYTANLADMTASIMVHTGTSPFANRAELSETPGSPFMLTQSLSKETTEQAVRALSEVSNTRTWNVLIDVVGQAGRYSPSADSLNKFQVQSQSRYWVHLAIDRYTGEIVDRRIEPAKE